MDDPACVQGARVEIRTIRRIEAMDEPLKPDDMLPLDEALALVFEHAQAGFPWLIGAENGVVDRAKRTVRYYAKRRLWIATNKQS
jgi:hypothetical protein